MDDRIKLKAHTIAVLKRMNNTYPSTTVDYDKLFLFDLLRAVFTKSDLFKCGTQCSLQHLNRPKLKFAKGFFVYSPFHTLFTYLYYKICFSFNITAVFSERVNADKIRFDDFKKYTIEIGQSI